MSRSYREEFRDLYRGLRRWGENYPLLPFATSLVVSGSLFLLTDESFITNHLHPLVYHIAPALLFIASRVGEDVSRLKLFQSMQKLKNFKNSDRHSTQSLAQKAIKATPSYIQRLDASVVTDKKYLLVRYFETSSQFIFPPMPLVGTVLTLRNVRRNLEDLKPLNKDVADLRLKDSIGR